MDSQDPVVSKPAGPGGVEPVWVGEKQLLIRRVRRWTAMILVLLPIASGLTAWSCTRSTRWTLEFMPMFVFGSIGGFLAMAVTTEVSRENCRPMRRADVVRMVCWVIVGFGLGSGCGYNLLAVPMVVGGLVMIVITSVVFPSPRPFVPGTCLRCGYDLRSLVDARCPECGTPFGPGVPGRQ